MVLDDIDLEVEAHDVICLIGSSGSGKSTLLRCLDLLEDVDDGVIEFEGREVSDPRVDRARGAAADGDGLPGLQPLPAPHRPRQRDPRAATGPRPLAEAEAEQQAHELLDRFGLADQAGKHPDRLSGGQQQRVALVRALATRPALLLLDEITAALDPELVGDVLTVVRDLAQAGTTMVLATHEMTFAREVATRVCFLDDGRILESGPPEQVFTDPREERTRQFLRRVLP